MEFKQSVSLILGIALISTICFFSYQIMSQQIREKLDHLLKIFAAIFLRFIRIIVHQLNILFYFVASVHRIVISISRQTHIFIRDFLGAFNCTMTKIIISIIRTVSRFFSSVSIIWRWLFIQFHSIYYRFFVN